MAIHAGIVAHSHVLCLRTHRARFAVVNPVREESATPRADGAHGNKGSPLQNGLDELVPEDLRG